MAACGARTELRGRSIDASPIDARTFDAGMFDAGMFDARTPDASRPDVAQRDSSERDQTAVDVVLGEVANPDTGVPSVVAPDRCTPSCVGRECGSDGCGGRCGDCSSGLFCDSSQRCSPCPEGAPCNNGNACETATIRCANNRQTCVRSGVAPAGTACLGGTCNGSGECSAIAPSFLLIVDSSGSMRVADAGPNACGFEPRRINSVACGLFELGRRTQNALWAMQTFGLSCVNSRPHLEGGSTLGCGAIGCQYSFPAITPAPDPAANGGYPFAFYGCDDAGTLWIPMSSTANRSLSAWGDGVFSSCENNVPLGAQGGPDLVYSQDVWQEVPSRFTPLAGALRYAARYLENRLPSYPSPYVRFDGTTSVDPYGHRRDMNIVLLTDGEECCASGANSGCDLSQSNTGAIANARNLGCLRVDLDGNGRIDDPLPMNHSNVALRGRYESNVDNNRDGDCVDDGEQRAFRTRVFVMAFGAAVLESGVEAIALAGGSPLRRIGGVLTTRRGYYIRSAVDFSRAIDELVSASVSGAR